MSYSAQMCRYGVIGPALVDMTAETERPFVTPEAQAMLLTTAWIESGFGLYLAQQPHNGPAFGIMQIECRASRTAQDVIRRRVIPSDELSKLWLYWTGLVPASLLTDSATDRLSRVLMANHHACVMLARLRYLDEPEPMPALEGHVPNILLAHASYWHRAYNRGPQANLNHARSKLLDVQKSAELRAEIEDFRDKALANAAGTP